MLIELTINNIKKQHENKKKVIVKREIFLWDRFLLPLNFIYTVILFQIQFVLNHNFKLVMKLIMINNNNYSILSVIIIKFS